MVRHCQVDNNLNRGDGVMGAIGHPRPLTPPVAPRAPHTGLSAANACVRTQCGVYNACNMGEM